MDQTGKEIKRLTKADIGTELDGVIVTAVKLIYENSGFVIFACKGGISVKGKYGGDIVPGLKFKVSGLVTSYQEKPQISAASIELVADDETTRNYISAFLSDNFDGVGQKTGKLLAEQFGESVIDVFLNEPDTIPEKIPGFGIEKAVAVSNEIEENESRLRLIFDLRLMGLTHKQSVKAYDEFGLTCKDKIEDNPYILMKISGIGFETCESIAKRLNTEPLSITRFEGAIAGAVSSILEENGDTYLEPSTVRNKVISLVASNTGGQIPEEIFDGLYRDALDRAKTDKFITIFQFKDGKCRGCDIDDEGARITSCEYFGTEAAIKKEIESFIDAKTRKPDEEKTRELIRKMGRERCIELDKLQEDALFLCMYSPLAIVTGGPGTGKTTITSILAQHFKDNNIDFEFCAPTGRAAKRLSEASGVEASTIHRLLEMSAPADDDEDGGTKAFFGRNSHNPLECRVVVADEASMIDIFLFKALLDALRPGASLILVGDPEQLPSVGAGNVLADLLSCPSIPNVRLEYTFRQDEESSIASNAVRILRGEYPVSGDDFEIITTASDEEALPVIERLSIGNRNADCAILSPTRRNTLGTENLNVILQQKHNEDSGNPVKVRSDLDLYPDDSVMQIKNNYSIEYFDPSNNEVSYGIFNGEMGKFDGYDILSGKYNIIYDDRKVGYTKKMMKDVELAYAVTVHKAQGCEFDSVVVVLGKMNYKLTNRKLLYTAVTRGRNKVTIIDSEGRLGKMLRNEADNFRKTSLSDFLKIVSERHKNESS
ncbi:MAG: AAA family ATPase [Clostridiales bacterium]|nr:AAA family ATPase [Clostridiales bacterium]